jgi:hypothetical protein
MHSTDKEAGKDWVYSVFRLDRDHVYVYDNPAAGGNTIVWFSVVPNQMRYCTTVVARVRDNSER